MSTSRSLDAFFGRPIPAKRWIAAADLEYARDRNPRLPNEARDASFGLRPQKISTVMIARSWPVAVLMSLSASSS